ncbi:hypothetical protein SODALDRAFT_277427 [Sodiomyces alkalinus F11]|uniref:cAMP-independent regulatory protein pac2 n=1 Tax=Sodiomyces alkalinus (strain CBS 110278 / VKM F-3762 / F11) TaxID=1314773 RepID=A0A3N2PV71_SODAK|nr:hypothetical protein SODALDRAFT_277427 [Sodiomyces alkalinus F11]ROT38378.1 hypothetical protein SODALDRAFT_277427 [Sodiomyces alkalinus F11]
METYYGHVRSPADAIKLFEACRLGLLPRVQRRLSEKERQSIRPGSVFVWDEREAGMRRWTDGKSWSASRVSGSFLTYREMEGKRAGGFGNNSSRRGATKTPDSNRGSDEDQENGGPEGYKYKADGLMKQSFSITTSATQHLHLISYYARPRPGDPQLLQPTSDPNLRHIVPPKGMYPESSLHDNSSTPALTRAPMIQHPPYAAQHLPHPGPPPQHHPLAHYPPLPPGYQWSPTPLPFSPYGQHHHYTSAPYPPHDQKALPAPNGHDANGHHSHPSTYAGPPPHYVTHPLAYDRPTLPPPMPQALTPSPALYAAQQQPSQPPHPSQQSPHTSHTISEASPRAQHLQAQAAQAVMMDSCNGSQFLPSIKREGSPSSPRVAESDNTGAEDKTSISALLRTPLVEPHRESGPGRGRGPGPGPNGSIPQPGILPRTGVPLSGMLGPAERPGGSSHDARALQLLDRKFCA